MKKTLRILALLIALASIGYWYSAGANLGWTKNRVEVKTMDEITGIEASHWEDAFIPGLDFLSVSIGAAAFLTGSSFLFKSKNQKQKTIE